MKRDDRSTVWKKLLFVVAIIVMYVVVILIMNPSTPEETLIHYYDEFSQYITPQSTYVLNLTERILGKQTANITDVPQVQRYISYSFNITDNETTYPYRTIERGCGSTNSLIALELSILYNLDPYLLVIDYEDKIKKEDNHVALLVVDDSSALLSDFIVEPSKMSYICRFKSKDFVYDMLVHTPTMKYDIKYLANLTEEFYFDDNLEFKNWLDDTFIMDE